MEDCLYLMWVNGTATFFTGDGSLVTTHDCSSINADHVREAIRELGFKGNSASLLYEGEYISHHDIDVPAMSDKHTGAFIRRRLRQEIHAVDASGLIAFIRSSLPPHLLFDVLDLNCFNAIQTAFAANGIAVEMVSSLIPAMIRIAGSINHPDPLLIQYADISAHMNFLLYYDVEKQAPALFRNSPLATSQEHILHDLNRSLQLGKQFFAGREPDLFLISDDDLEVDGATRLGGSDVLRRAMPDIPFQRTTNFVPESLRSIHAQNIRMRIAYAVVGVFILAAVASHIYLNREIESMRVALVQIQSSNSAVSGYINHIRKFERIETFDHAVLDEHGTTPLLLMANIGVMLGPEFRLNAFSAVDRHDASFDFTLKGDVLIDPKHAAAALRKLEKRLTSEPYHAEIVRSWKEYWLKGMQAWTNLKRGPEDSEVIPFIIEGVIHE